MIYHALEPVFRRVPHARRLYERSKKLYYAMVLPDMIATFEAALLGVVDAFVLQVGANDGAQGDPIHALFDRHPCWRGVLVEPVPFVFERLRRNYRNDPRFVYENAAIAERSGRLPFYHVSSEARSLLGDEVGVWADAVSSFDRAHILRCDPRLEPFVVEENVACMRLGDLLERHAVARIDAVCIDTEGHDERVLAQLDVERFRPKAILYEHKHLAKADRRRADRRLAAAGYTLRRYDYDTLAVLAG